MLGIPRSEERFIFEQTNVIMAASDAEYVSDQTPRGIARAVGAAGQRLADLLHGLAEDRIKTPRGDLISLLVAATAEENLTPDELAAFFILLVGAGNETTRNAIAHGLLALTQFPRQRALWQGDPPLTRRARLKSSSAGHRPCCTCGARSPGRRPARRPGIRGGRQGGALVPLGQPGRGLLLRRHGVRRHPRTQPARHLRLAGTTPLPRRQPGPAGAHGHVPGAVRAAARHPRGRLARAAAVQLPARHQAPAGRVHPGAERGGGGSADGGAA